jgi:hypothetical protein
MLRNPRREDQLLFTCTRQRFLPEHHDRLAAIVHGRPPRWEEIYSTARDHGVAPLVGVNLRQAVWAQVPAAVRACFELCTQRNVLVKSLHAERIRNVLAFFARRNIRVLLAKGAGLDSVVYEKPWYTISADIDLMIGCRAEALSLHEHAAVDNLMAGRNPLERRIPIESEWYVHHDVSMNGLLRVDFAALWQAARPISLGDQTALVMAPEHMLLAACINSCRKRFFRLKAICDIAEVVAAGAIGWEDVVRWARQWRCENIVYTALRVAAMTVGCRVPCSVFDEFGVAPLRRRVIDFLSARQSFTALAVGNRRPGPGLLLPMAAYRWGALLTNLALVCREYVPLAKSRVAGIPTANTIPPPVAKEP